MPVHGVLNLYKPTGPTSHDCVSRVRRQLRERRVGHAGTLDPLACGVLLLGVGQGTRVLEYLQALPKVYRARLLLGLETDSQDITGSALAECDAAEITSSRLEESLGAFRGESLQMPPMHSAVRVGGRRLYELARQGETVERAARTVTVHSLELLSFAPGPRAEAEIRVACSAGTYVRTLCHDLGLALGTGAVMSALEREAIGPFRAEAALPLEVVVPGVPLLPLAAALEHLPAVTLPAEEAARLSQGQLVAAPPGIGDGLVRVLDEGGALLALATAGGHGAARMLAPGKVFLQG